MIKNLMEVWLLLGLNARLVSCLQPRQGLARAIPGKQEVF